MGRVPKLESLHLRANKISMIAETLRMMPALTYLDLGGNALREVPPPFLSSLFSPAHFFFITLHTGPNQLRPLIAN